MADTMKDAIANTKSLRRTLRSLLAVADVVDGIADLEGTVQNLKDQVKEEGAELTSVKVSIVEAKVDRQSIHESLARAKEDVRIAMADAVKVQEQSSTAKTIAEDQAKQRKKEADNYYAVAKQMADKNLARINSEIELRKQDNEFAMAGYAAQVKVEQDKIDDLRSKFDELVEGMKK